MTTIPSQPPAPWDVAHDSVQLEAIKFALNAAKGNITRAAELVMLSRQQLTKMVKKYALAEYAAQLRVASGEMRHVRGSVGPVLGRPRTRNRKKS